MLSDIESAYCADGKRASVQQLGLQKEPPQSLTQWSRPAAT